MLNKKKRIIYIQYTNPAGYPPLEHSSRILAERGWEILFLGKDTLYSKDLLFPPHPNITVYHLSYMAGGWQQKLHYIFYMVWVLYWTSRWRPQWIYASDPLACPIALLLSYLPGLRILYHEHDSPASDGHTASTFMRLVYWGRRHLAQRARLCVLPNEQRARLFAQHTGTKRTVLTVWNCPRIEEIAPSRTWEMTGCLRVYYHGTIGPARIPTALLDALALLPDSIHLYIIGYETIGSHGYGKHLQELAQRLNVTERVHVCTEGMSRQELLPYSRQYDVGLALLPPSPSDLNLQEMIGASNKAFDYLASGLALLVSDRPAWVQLYVEPGYGLACNPADPQSIAAALRWFLEHFQEMRTMDEWGRQRILDEWNYEHQFAPVYEILCRGDRA